MSRSVSSIRLPRRTRRIRERRIDFGTDGWSGGNRDVATDLVAPHVPPLGFAARKEFQAGSVAHSRDHVPHLVGLRGMYRAGSVNGGRALGALAINRGSIGEAATHTKEAVFGLASGVPAPPDAI